MTRSPGACTTSARHPRTCNPSGHRPDPPEHCHPRELRSRVRGRPAVLAGPGTAISRRTLRGTKGSSTASISMPTCPCPQRSRAPRTPPPLSIPPSPRPAPPPAPGRREASSPPTTSRPTGSVIEVASTACATWRQVDSDGEFSDRCKTGPAGSTRDRELQPPFAERRLPRPRLDKQLSSDATPPPSSACLETIAELSSTTTALWRFAPRRSIPATSRKCVISSMTLLSSHCHPQAMSRGSSTRPHAFSPVRPPVAAQSRHRPADAHPHRDTRRPALLAPRTRPSDASCGGMTLR